MARGLNFFKEWFKGYEQNYVVIGGTACELLMGSAGLDFRATKDIDMVLIVESLSKEFCGRFWEYIKAGGYEIEEKSGGEPCFYRFQKPKLEKYPVMIELFARKPDCLTVPKDVHLVPLHVDDELSSLSAILLDEEYYGILQNGTIQIDGISVIDTQHIILFKIKAWKDLLNSGAEKGKYTKHKNDVFRLAQLLIDGSPLVVSQNIMKELDAFIVAMQKEDINLKGIGVSGKKDDLLQLLKRNFVTE